MGRGGIRGGDCVEKGVGMGGDCEERDEGRGLWRKG